jgi:hypothetical protein
MDKMLTNPDEIDIVRVLLRWETGMPAPGKYIDTFENSQMIRLRLVLVEIGKKRGGAKFYEPLASMATGERGKRYIANRYEDMGTPWPLTEGWYLEGTMSLEQKRGLLHHLLKFRWSVRFVACAEDFVAGKSVLAYQPAPFVSAAN